MRHAALVAFIVVGLLSACGGAEEAVVAPRAVPDDLVPAELTDLGLAFFETSVAEARTAFTEAGENSLASDGRLWEMRIADRLVGVLQLTTMRSDVDAHDADVRDSFVKQLLPTARDRFDVGDVSVWSAQTQGKSIYLWFGDGMFSLFTMKPASDDNFDPEAVLSGVLDHMVASSEWEYVYVDEAKED